MNNFKEKANQFLKENYGIENRINDDSVESRLEFCHILIDLVEFEDGPEFNEIVDILMEGIKFEEDRFINLLYYEAEYTSGDLYWSWGDISIDFDSFPEVEKIVYKRDKEIDSPLAFTDDEKESIRYCFQDIIKDEKKYSDFLNSTIREFLYDSLLDGDCFYGVSRNECLENFFKIMLL